jgi:uncharacterized membrane protein
VRALVLLVALGCDGAPEGDTGACPSWQDTVRPVTIAYCDACHAATSRDRHEAPADVTFDTEAEAEAWAGRMLARVDANEMPPGGGLSDVERGDLAAWAACVAP